MSMVIELNDLLELRKKFKEEKKKVVFTNGCFDLLHAGHVDYLNKAKALGDFLIVGLNSDASVRRIKGARRPLINQKERALIISNLKAVDYVVIFEEDTPAELISAIIPDVLIKGADWAADQIVGRNIVEANGGEVKTIKFEIDQSTTRIIELILNRYNK
jgi:rfaE bifunctional protein nucleotidyltransferase chain/domain